MEKERPRVSPYCAFLRTKKSAFRAVPARDEAELMDASGACWCGKTLKAVGPDADVCGPEDCQSDRSCFEPIV